MKRNLVLVGIFCLCFCGISWAGAIDRVDLSGLNEEQKAQLVMQAEQMKKTVVEPTQDFVEKANEYTQLAENISTVIVTVAGKVGIAADEFLKSTSGKITVGLIFWKVAGKDITETITKLVVGIGLFLVMMPLWVYFFRRMCLIKSIEFQTPDQGYRKKKVVTYMDPGNSDTQGTRLWMLAVLIVGIAVNLWIIF